MFDAPTAEEFRQVLKHLGEHTNEKSILSDFEIEIWNWVKNKNSPMCMVREKTYPSTNDKRIKQILLQHNLPERL